MYSLYTEEKNKAMNQLVPVEQENRWNDEEQHALPQYPDFTITRKYCKLLGICLRYGRADLDTTRLSLFIPHAYFGRIRSFIDEIVPNEQYTALEEYYIGMSCLRFFPGKRHVPLDLRDMSNEVGNKRIEGYFLNRLRRRTEQQKELLPDEECLLTVIGSFFEDSATVTSNSRPLVESMDRICRRLGTVGIAVESKGMVKACEANAKGVITVHTKEHFELKFITPQPQLE